MICCLHLHFLVVILGLPITSTFTYLRSSTIWNFVLRNDIIGKRDQRVTRDLKAPLSDTSK